MNRFRVYYTSIKDMDDFKKTRAIPVNHYIDVYAKDEEEARKLVRTKLGNGYEVDGCDGFVDNWKELQDNGYES